MTVSRFYPLLRIHFCLQLMFAYPHFVGVFSVGRERLEAVSDSGFSLGFLLRQVKCLRRQRRMAFLLGSVFFSFLMVTWNSKGLLRDTLSPSIGQRHRWKLWATLGSSICAPSFPYVRCPSLVYLRTFVALRREWRRRRDKRVAQTRALGCMSRNYVTT